jgi:hypothetical protein
MAIRYLTGINVDSNTLFVDSTNNRVGIGTASPTAALHIVTGGSTQIRLQHDSWNYWDITSAYNTTNADLYFSMAGAEKFRINASGNVGIGTTSPAVKFVVSNAGASGFEVDPTGGVGAGPVLQAYNRSTSAYMAQSYYALSHTFNVGSGGSTRAIDITSAGNVGIGTTSPGYKLDVVASANSTYPFIVRNAGNVEIGGIYSTSGGAGQIYLFNASTVATVKISTIDSSYFTGGNVGIGTTSPGYKLDVDGTSRSDLHIFRSNQSAPTADAFIFRPADNTIALGTANSERMRITSAGNVGIGTTSPGYKLEVNGDIGFSIGASLKWGGNTYIYGENNVQIQAVVNGNTGLFINSSGNVGIGTTSPNNRLSVSGTGRVFNAVSSNDQVVASFTCPSTSSGISTVGFEAYGSTSDYHVRVGANATSFVAYTNNIERLRIDSSGNVGIGTNSPQVKLEVRGAQNNTIIPANAVAKFVGGDAGIFVGNLAGTPNYGAWLQAMRESDGLVFPLHLQPNGGNVGIGTTSPATKVTVGPYEGSRLPYINGTANTFNADGITVTSYNTANAGIGGGLDLTNNVYSIGSFSPLISFSSKTQSGTYNNNYAAIYGILAGDSGDGNWNSGHLVFATALAYGASEKMRITNAGNVGIGTTSPSSNLHVSGDTYVTGQFAQGVAVASKITGYGAEFRSSNASAQIFFGRSGDSIGSGGIGADETSTFIVWSIPSFVKLLVVNQNGNVGINTDAPSQKLHVAGNARVTGAYYDSNNSAGSSGQVLSSTGSGTDWVSLSEITGVDGTGTANYVAKWSDANTITDSGIEDTSSSVSIGRAAFYSPSNYGIYYSAITGASSGTAWYDTITGATGARIYNMVVHANPNSSGSGVYQDFYFGKVFVGTGYNGSAVVDYINYQQESQMPRSLYGSGGGNLTITAFFVVGGTEYTEIANGTTYTIRIKIAGYVNAGAGTEITLQRIM